MKNNSKILESLALQCLLLGLVLISSAEAEAGDAPKADEMLDLLETKPVMDSDDSLEEPPPTPPPKPKPDIVVTLLRPDRLVYRFGDNAVISVSLANKGAQKREGRLRVELMHGFAPPKLLLEEPISIAVGKSKNFSCRSSLGIREEGAEYGYEVRAIVTVEGQPDAAGSEYFMVTDNPLKIGHLTIPSGMMDDAHPYFGGKIDEGIERMRTNYFAMAEAPFWAPCDWSELATKRERWISGQAFRYMSQKGVRKVVKGVHDLGGWIVFYADKWACGPVGFEFARQHPNWFSWDSDWYGCRFSVADLENKAKGPLVDGKYIEGESAIWAILPLIARPEVARFGIEQIAASTRQFDWDGVRLDNNGWYVESGVSDLAGKRALSAGSDVSALEVELVDRIRKAGSVVKKHFIYGNNIGWYGGNHKYTFELDSAKPKWLAEVKEGGLAMTEYFSGDRVHAPGSFYNNWERLREHVGRGAELVRQAGGYPYGIFGTGPGMLYIDKQEIDLANPDAWPHAVPDQRSLYAMLMASGVHICYDVLPAYCNLMRLYARHCGLIYDPALVTVPEPETFLTVTGSRSLWWREYVRRRRLPDGRRQLIVHLINTPSGENVNVKAPAPPPQKDVKIEWRTETDKKPEKAFVISADGMAGPRTTPLKLTHKGKISQVTVPRLQQWCIVVFEGGE